MFCQATQGGKQGLAAAPRSRNRVKHGPDCIERRGCQPPFHRCSGTRRRQRCCVSIAPLSPLYCSALSLLSLELLTVSPDTGRENNRPECLKRDQPRLCLSMGKQRLNLKVTADAKCEFGWGSHLLSRLQPLPKLSCELSPPKVPSPQEDPDPPPSQSPAQPR